MPFCVHIFIYIAAFFFCPNEKNRRGRDAAAQLSFDLYCFCCSSAAVVVVAVGQGHLWTAKASRKWVQQPANAAKRKAGRGNGGKSVWEGEATPPRTAPEKSQRMGGGQRSKCKKLASNKGNLQLVGRNGWGGGVGKGAAEMVGKWGAGPWDTHAMRIKIVTVTFSSLSISQSGSLASRRTPTLSEQLPHISHHFPPAFPTRFSILMPFPSLGKLSAIHVTPFPCCRFICPPLWILTFCNSWFWSFCFLFRLFYCGFLLLPSDFFFLLFRALYLLKIFYLLKNELCVS